MMTFSEYIEKNPTLYDDIDIDDATKSNIFDWFQFREVCDDVRFSVYFRRELNINLHRYEELIRVDLTKIDPLVSTYRERQLKHTGSTKNSGEDTTETSHTGSFQRTIKDSGTDNSTATRTPDLMTTNTPGVETTQSTEYGKTMTRNGDQTDTPGVTETTTVDGQADVKQATKSMPQSISYQNSEAGQLPDFDWQYPSAQDQTSNKNKTTTTSSRQGSNTLSYNDITDKASGTDTVTTSYTGADKVEETGTDKTVSEVTYGKTQTITDTPQEQKEITTSTKGTGQSIEGEDREIWTGRDGLTPQEALIKMREYIRGTNAFEWLRNNLEVCFLGIYDV